LKKAAQNHFGHILFLGHTEKHKSCHLSKRSASSSNVGGNSEQMFLSHYFYTPLEFLGAILISLSVFSNHIITSLIFSSTLLTFVISNYQESSLLFSESLPVLLA
jgi:hypothetical protein